MARIGGGEVAWELPHVAGQASVDSKVRKRIRAIERPVHLDNIQIAVAVSAGISLYPHNAKTSIH